MDGGAQVEAQKEEPEKAKGAEICVHDQERGRSPRRRLPLAEVRPESRQEQPLSEVSFWKKEKEIAPNFPRFTLECAFIHCSHYRNKIKKRPPTIGRHEHLKA